MPKVREMGEWRLIAALQTRLESPASDRLGIGDDTAITHLPEDVQVLTTVDALVEGIHFRCTTTSPEALGWKALMVSLSDIAAMGGTPAWAVISLAVPPETEEEWVLKLYDGLRDAAMAGACPLVGGDTTGSRGTIMLSLTVVGYTKNPLYRHTVVAGDILFTTGPMGRSAAGLWCLENPDKASKLPLSIRQLAISAHTLPHAQLPAGKALGALPFRVSLMDNSDGLGVSVRLLAESSKTGMMLTLDDSNLDPVTQAVATLAGQCPWKWVLEGGEDYHLVGATAPAHWDELCHALAQQGVIAHVIGHATEQMTLTVSLNQQPPQPLSQTHGYRHF